MRTDAPTLRQVAFDVWHEPVLEEKLRRTAVLPSAGSNDPLWSVPDTAHHLSPGRPDRPLLVPPTAVKRRSLASQTGRIALLHALAHIEFNAVNLALDAIWRFDGFPATYYSDWRKVAIEEAAHFTLLRDHLRAIGCEYGDCVAHDGLWDMARKTVHDALARMALVPRVLEARGLDVTPGLIAKLTQSGDHKAADILKVILQDEIGHVAIGTHWYHWLCNARGLEPVETFLALMAAHNAPLLRSPPNMAARLAAGFTADEIRQISSIKFPSGGSETSGE